MTQLILDTGNLAVQLPESQRGRYTAKLEPLSESVQMISGRTVKEVRGKVWVVTYQYGYLSDTLKNNAIAACETGVDEPISCSFLTQGSAGALTTLDFYVESFTRPKFMWSSSGAPLWADFSVTLRGADPVD